MSFKLVQIILFVIKHVQEQHLSRMPSLFLIIEFI